MKIDDIQKRLTNIEVIAGTVTFLKNAIEANTKVLSDLLAKIENTDKFINTSLKTQTKLQCEEDELHDDRLDEFKDFTKFKSIERLQEFENTITDQQYAINFVRFIRSKFTMNGCQDGKTFFREVMRFLCDVSILKDYTWKGVKRKDKTNISFEAKHKVFVKFIKKMVKIADKTVNESQVEDMFSNFLRFKSVYEKQENTGKPLRKPASRSRAKRNNILDDQTDDQDEDKENSEYNSDEAASQIRAKTNNSSDDQTDEVKENSEGNMHVDAVDSKSGP